MYRFVVIQLLSHVWLFMTPWTAAHQAYLSFTISRVGSNSCPLSQWCHLPISFSVTPLSSRLQSFPASFPIVRKHLTRGFLCADLDLSGTLWSLLIPEYSGIKRRGTPFPPFPGLRNPGISHYSDKHPLPYYEPNGKRWLFATLSLW